MVTTTSTQRGIKTINLLFIDDDIITIETPAEFRGGRNPLLIEKRDELLLHRTYFKSSIQRRLYGIILNELENEFFISKTMIQKIIQSQSDALLQIKKNKPTTKELKEKWPHIVWA